MQVVHPTEDLRYLPEFNWNAWKTSDRFSFHLAIEEESFGLATRLRM